MALRPRGAGGRGRGSLRDWLSGRDPELLVDQVEVRDQLGFAAADDLSTDYVARAWQPAELVSVTALRAAELAASAMRDVLVTTAPTGAANGHAAPTWWRAGIVEATENRP